MRTVDDLITWLRAQLDDDEQLASALTLDDGGCWSMERVGRVIDEHGREVAECTELGRVESQHIARHDPARVLAEVDAKRRILDEHNIEYPGEAFQYCHVCHDHSRHDAATAPCRTLRLLALPFADRPGYREDWRP